MLVTDHRKLSPADQWDGPVIRLPFRMSPLGVPVPPLPGDLEEADRQAWLVQVRDRLGLVTADDPA